VSPSATVERPITERSMHRARLIAVVLVPLMASAWPRWQGSAASSSPNGSTPSPPSPSPPNRTEGLRPPATKVGVPRRGDHQGRRGMPAGDAAPGGLVGPAEIQAATAPRRHCRPPADGPSWMPTTTPTPRPTSPFYRDITGCRRAHRQRVLPQGEPERRRFSSCRAGQRLGEEIALDLDAVSSTCPSATSCSSRPTRRASTTSSSRRPARAAQTPSATATGAVELAVFLRRHYSHAGVRHRELRATGATAFCPLHLGKRDAVGRHVAHQDSSDRGWSETVWTGSGSGCSRARRQAVVADRLGLWHARTRRRRSAVPIPTPASPCTTATDRVARQLVPVGARASPRRSSPRVRHGRQPAANRTASYSTRTGVPLGRGDRQQRLVSGSTCARPSRDTTAPPGWERLTSRAPSAAPTRPVPTTSSTTSTSTSTSKSTSRHVHVDVHATSTTTTTIARSPAVG